jgi:alkaline phosphatase D
MRATGNGWVPYRRDYRKFLDIIGGRNIIFLSGDIHENAFLPPSTGTRLFEIIASGAAVTKYKLVGKRENYGLLEYSPASTTVTLYDRRRHQSYRIDNASFEYEELE